MTHARDDFDTQLEALQILLQQEHSEPEHRRYIKPIHKDVVPLQIIFNEFLRGSCGITNTNVMRDMKIAMLQFILKKEIKSTYDLTLYQCSTISHFLREKDEGGIYFTPERATSFLEGCKNAVESTIDGREREDKLLEELGY